MPGETDNFYRRCRHPAFAARALASIFGKALRAIERRVFAPQYYYPPEVRRAVSADPDSREASRITSVDRPPFALKPGRLQLAVGEVSYVGEPPWEMRFKDPEMEDSLHRWNWLLTSVNELPPVERRATGIGLMRSWLAHHSQPFVGRRWNTYSTGERVANAVLFFLLNSERGEAESEIPGDIRLALAQMAAHVAANLEYHGAATGNHAFNNGRALFLAAAALGRKDLAALAVAIMRERLPVLVTKDGFLREGSSHYHFLFTRWLLECHLIAKRCGHEPVAEWLSPFCRRMVERCWFFLVRDGMSQWTLPLIGDVSPDFPPGWLISLPWSEEARAHHCPAVLPPRPKSKGWAELWPARCEIEQSARDGKVIQSGGESYPASHWYRLERDEWILFVRSAPDPGIVEASHRHNDLGGFVAFWRGREVLTDVGRLNYDRTDPIGTHGLSAAAHNTVLLDGCGPTVDILFARAPRFYRTIRANSITQIGPDETSFSLRHDGFSRLGRGEITHERVLRLSRSTLFVEDRIEGYSSHDLQVTFHWAPTVKLLPQENIVAILVDLPEGTARGVFRQEGERQARMEEIKGRSGDEPQGWYSRAYGQLESCPALVLKHRAALPWRQKFSLSFQ
jgi:hypothetical protein